MSDERVYREDELLTPKEAARVLGISESALRARRLRGLWPPCGDRVITDGLVRYRYSNLMVAFPPMTDR